MGRPTQYSVSLSQEEKEKLLAMSKDNKLSARVSKSVLILLALDNKTNSDIVDQGPKATGTHDRCACGRKSFVCGLASPIVRTANQTRTLCMRKQWFSVLTLCAPTHGFSNKCLFCHVYRRLSTLLAIKNVGANQ